jgi:ATP-dependent Clp protease ATP-binding subunit ClpC
MFERFTARARRIVVLAQEEARMLNHNYIGTEHILLGLIHEGEGVAARTLQSLGVDLPTVRAQIEEIIGRGQSASTGHVPFTPRAKKVLELSLREAVQLGHKHIGSEHILLGLVREGEGVAAQVLEKLGASLNVVRQKVLELGQEEGWFEAAEAPRRPHQAPRCPRCSEELAETARIAGLEVEEAEGEAGRPVVFVFCRRCGTTLGAWPADR